MSPSSADVSGTVVLSEVVSRLIRDPNQSLLIPHLHHKRRQEAAGVAAGGPDPEPRAQNQSCPLPSREEVCVDSLFLQNPPNHSRSCRCGPGESSSCRPTERNPAGG